MYQHSASNHKPILFLRTPQLEQMRNPLLASWNQALPNRGSEADPEINLAGLVDFSLLNDVFSSYLEVIGLPVAIINFDGRVLASSNWQRLCMEFHRTNQGTLARCLESDIYLSREIQEGRDYAIYRCRNGLTDCATPIIIEGQHIANLFIGQFFLAPPDLGEFEERCAEYGFDHDRYFRALSEVPIVDEGKIPAILRMLVGFANQIAKQSLAEHRAQIAFEEIEKKVVERTRSLSESLSFNETILFCSPLPMAVYASNGQCVLVNDSFARLTGASSGALLDQNINNLNNWKKSSLLDNFQSALQSGLSQHGEAHFVTSFGKEIWVEYQISSVKLHDSDHLLVQCVDIIDRKQSEEKLRINEERYRLLADNLVDNVWIMGLDGRFSYISPSIERLRGYTPAEFIQQSMAEILTPSSLVIAQTYLNRIASSAQARLPVEDFRGEIELVHKDGSIIITEITAHPILDDNGDIKELVGVTRDITERKQHEIDLKTEKLKLQEALAVSENLRSRLEESNKRIKELAHIEERSRLYRDLHDGAGQSLHAVALHLELLADGKGNNLDLKMLAGQLAREVTGVAAEMREIAHQLRPSYLHEITLDVAIRKRCEMLRLRRVPIEITTVGDFSAVSHEVSDNMYRIAQEALANAARHSGAATITTRLTNTGNTIQLSIADNGCGLGDRPGEGDGLGLTIMRERASLIGADLVISSTSSGTTITATLELP